MKQLKKAKVILSLFWIQMTYGIKINLKIKLNFLKEIKILKFVTQISII